MKKALLIVLDGFGYSPKIEHNAVALSKSPFIDKLFDTYPHNLLQCSGESVGLPDGVMGNSEVGHLSIGSGRVIYQDLTRISKFAEEKSFLKHPLLLEMVERKKPIHLLGLLSDGGVHSHIDHWVALIQQIKEKNSHQEIYLHPFTDGRDTPPTSGKTYLENLEAEVVKHSGVKISSLCGRYFAMDRDKRWDRVEKAYRCLCESVSERPEFSSAQEAIKDAYQNQETDEFVKPRIIQGGRRIGAEDSVLFVNFRADRARELSMACAQENFSEFSRSVVVNKKHWYCFTRYQEEFQFPVFFEKEIPQKSLGELISKAGGTQLRIAETEKYAHVTYFFSGGREELFEGEERILIDSPKEVATYDLKPEMSAHEVTHALVKSLQEKEPDLIVVNYANGDMVGHTGNEQAAIDAVEALDACLAQLIPAALERNYEILLSADHGNCEQMLDEETGEDFTQHTTNPVPVLWIGKEAESRSINSGSLIDIAPTILELMELPKPNEMTGKSLIAK